MCLIMFHSMSIYVFRLKKWRLISDVIFHELQLVWTKGHLFMKGYLFIGSNHCTVSGSLVYIQQGRIRTPFRVWWCPQPYWRRFSFTSHFMLPSDNTEDDLLKFTQQKREYSLQLSNNVKSKFLCFFPFIYPLYISCYSPFYLGDMWVLAFR